MCFSELEKGGKFVVLSNLKNNESKRRYPKKAFLNENTLKKVFSKSRGGHQIVRYLWQQFNSTSTIFRYCH